MDMLHEATRQYLRNPDPVEAAARRQRVHFGDANGEIEEAISDMITAAEERFTLATQGTIMENDPVTPPPFQLNPHEAWMFPDPSVVTSPPFVKELDLGLEIYYTEEEEPEKEKSLERLAIRSIIVSPNIVASGPTDPQPRIQDTT